MAMKAWVSGNLQWSFSTIRYFGTEKDQVRETLTVTLYPPKRWKAKQ